MQRLLDQNGHLIYRTATWTSKIAWVFWRTYYAYTQSWPHFPGGISNIFDSRSRLSVFLVQIKPI